MNHYIYEFVKSSDVCNYKLIKEILMSNLDPLQITCLSVTFYDVCTNGELTEAKLLYRLDSSLATHQSIKNVFYNTCKNGHLDVAQWLMSINPDILTDDATTISHYAMLNYAEDVILAVLTHKHDNVALWLLSLAGTSLEYSVCNSLLNVAGSSGCNESKKFLYKTYPMFFEPYTENMFKNSNMEISRWLLSLNPNLSQHINKAFISACEHGDHEKAKWLYSMDSSVDVDDSFVRACCRVEDLEFMQWLYDLTTANVSIAKGFAKACRMHNFIVAKWCFDKDPTILTTELFKEIIDINGETINWTTAEFLLLLKPDIEF